ncbi:MAG TPA: DUF952 domain-containing protein [Chitinophagaceae bacterium]
MIIYHITTAAAWRQSLVAGYYEAPSLITEGFIHCSTESQVSGVLERYFSGKTKLLKLVIDTERLSSPLKFELAPSVNEEFPHIYGRLNHDAVVAVVPIAENR